MASDICVGDACADNVVKSGAASKEFGVKRGAVATYERTDGKKTKLTLSAEDMQDATGAYSAFTLARAGMRSCSESAQLGHDCALAPGHLLFWKGETLVDIRAEGGDPIRLPELQPLLDLLPKPAGTKAALPLLPKRLPQAGLERESIRYAVGPATYAKLNVQIPAEIVDFSKSPEIILAKYSGRKSGNGTLTVFFYPTNQIAGDRSRAMEALLKSSPNVAVKRIATMVAVAGGAFSHAQAVAMVDSVTDHEQFTFNDPSGYQPHVETVQESVSVMVQILIFVCVMTLAALVLGVFFGGARALIRKAQGKPASSLADMEFIKLEIGGKLSTKLQMTPESGEGSVSAKSE